MILFNNASWVITSIINSKQIMSFRRTNAPRLNHISLIELRKLVYAYSQKLVKLYPGMV